MRPSVITGLKLLLWTVCSCSTAPRAKGAKPKILTTVRVEDFGIDLKHGPWINLERKGESQRVSAVPSLLFGQPVFVSVPPRLMLRWDARWHAGRVYRSLQFGLLIKTANRAEVDERGGGQARPEARWD